MSTIIYLSNQQIKIVTGTEGKNGLSVHSCYQTEAPSGTLINGIVMDAEEFAPFIKQYLAENKIPAKEISLVLNSTNFFEKVTEMPNLNEKKTKEYIEREFANIDRNKNPIYAYFPMIQEKQNKFRAMYVESVDADYLQSYIELFEGIGVKVKGIYSSLSSLIGMFSAIGQIRTKTYLLQIVDGNNLANILWVNGSYYYASSNRLFHNAGTEEFAMDLSRSVSQIQQFMSAHKIEYSLESIYLAGIGQEDFNRCEAEIKPLVDTTTKVWMYESPRKVKMASGVRFHNYIYPVSGLYKNVKSHNFLLDYEKKKKAETGKKYDSKAIIIIATTFVVTVIAVIISAVLLHNDQKKLEEVKQFNESAQVKSQVLDYENYLALTAGLSAQYKSIKKICKYMDTYPIYSSTIESIINGSAKKYADIEMEGFTAADGVVTFRARSKNTKTINKFIQVLKKQGIFEKVDYSGYSYQEDVGAWDINVTCILAADVGR